VHTKKTCKGWGVKLHSFLPSPLEWSEFSTGCESHSWSDWQDKNRLLALSVIEPPLFGGPVLSLISIKEGILHELSTGHYRPNSSQYLFRSTFIRIALFPRTNKQCRSVPNRYMPQCCYLVSTYWKSMLPVPTVLQRIFIPIIPWVDTALCKLYYLHLGPSGKHSNMRVWETSVA